MLNRFYVLFQVKDAANRVDEAEQNALKVKKSTPRHLHEEKTQIRLPMMQQRKKNKTHKISIPIEISRLPPTLYPKFVQN